MEDRYRPVFIPTPDGYDDYLLVARIMMLRRNYLVHCFLYYELGETLISDEKYWKVCDELIWLQKKYPDLCAGLPLHKECINLSTDYSRPNKPDGTAFTKSDYGLDTATVALHLLYREKKSRTSFQKFAEKYGYNIK